MANLLDLLTPKIKVTRSVETLLYFHPVTRHNIPEDLSLQQLLCEKLGCHGGHQYISQANTGLSNVKDVRSANRKGNFPWLIKAN